MAESAKIFTPEILPPEAQDMHPFNRPVAFNMQNTLHSPLFWFLLGMGGMWAVSHYFGKRGSRRDA